MLVMYDDVTASLIPASAQAVAGYVNGDFANYSEIVAGWPNAHHLSIAVHPDVDADALDCEAGDAAPADFGPWALRQIKLHGPGWKPVGYAAVSNIMAALQSALSNGIPREGVRLWSAHTGHGPHLCGPQCGFGLSTVVDGTQWDWFALGRNLDESLLNDAFFAPVPPPVPPKPVDPNHYLWFHEKERRGHVESYDRLRRHPIKNRVPLKVLRRELQRGADAIAISVIDEAKIKGKPRDWTTNHRGWRYQALIKRANGKRVVK